MAHNLPHTSLMTDAVPLIADPEVSHQQIIHQPPFGSQLTSGANPVGTISATDEEIRNFYHLACIIMNHGADIVRKKLVQCLGNESLDEWLRQNQHSLRSYVKRNQDKKPRLLDNYQWKMLVGDGETFAKNPNDFDLSFLVALVDIYMREKHGKAEGLKTSPEEGDDSWQANFVRLRCKRNQLFGHAPRLSLRNDEYGKALDELKVILKALGAPDEVFTSTHEVIPVEKLRELERQFVCLPDEQVQRVVEKCLKLVMDPLIDFKTCVCATIEDLQKRIAALEDDKKRSASGNTAPAGAGVTNQFIFNGPTTNLQVGDGNRMVVYHSESTAPRGASQVSSCKKENKKKPKKKITVPAAEVDAVVLERVTHAIGAAWRDLGRQLELSDADLDVIYHDFCDHGLHEVAHQMLREWHERSGRNATVGVLAKALVKIRKHEIAKTLGSS